MTEAKAWMCDKLLSAEEIEAEITTSIIEMERKKAEAKGQKFDPNSPAVRELVDLAVAEAFDEMGFSFDPEMTPERTAEIEAKARAHLAEVEKSFAEAEQK